MIDVGGHPDTQLTDIGATTSVPAGVSAANSCLFSPATLGYCTSLYTV